MRRAVGYDVHGCVPDLAGVHHRGQRTNERALVLFLQTQVFNQRRRFSLHGDEHGDRGDAHRALFLFVLLVKRAEDQEQGDEIRGQLEHVAAHTKSARSVGHTEPIAIGVVLGLRITTD